MKIRKGDGIKMTREEIEEHIASLLDLIVCDQRALNINEDSRDDWNKAVDDVIERLEKMKSTCHRPK